jgi:peptidoglycan/xylan/chitin deacetylase (PgdA/CDA1 family)
LDESNSVVSTSPSTFKKQMEFLWQSGYRTISLSEIADSIFNKASFPEKSLAITFDDGYKNNYTEAFPVLKRFGFNATIFLVFDYCGKLNDWPGHSSAIERRPLLSWSEIHEMHKYGIEFGAHTLTHPDLTQIPLQQAEREIILCKNRLQDRLGMEVNTFAYPYGRYNSGILEIIRGAFRVACSTKLGNAELQCDPFLLKRIDMYYLTSLKLFRRFSTLTLNRYLQVRNILHELKELLL